VAGDRTELVGILRPVAIAVSPIDDSLFVLDQGTQGIPASARDVPGEAPAALWRVTAPGTAPQRIGDMTLKLQLSAALAVNAASGNVYVLDTTTLLELAPPYTVAKNKTPTATFRAPVSMAFLPDGHLLVLDRGKPIQSGEPAVPTLIEITLEPLSARVQPLTGVVEPMSLCVTAAGEVIVGDGREQAPASGAATIDPADLVLVNPSTGAGTRLLGTTASRLSAPVAVVAEDERHLLVLDLGLKPFFRGLDSDLAHFDRHLAEPAALYRVTRETSRTAAEIAPASEAGDLVTPTGLALRQGVAYITDKGEFSNPDVAGALPRFWRARPHEFGVIVHFSTMRMPSNPDRRRILRDMSEIIDREKPAHTEWTLVASMAKAET
jgi:hypothetical protein